MRLPLFFKFFGGFISIILLFSLSILLITLSEIKSFQVDSLAGNLEKLGRSLILEIIPYLESERYQELDGFVKKFGRHFDTRITVVDKKGVVLADSDEDPKGMSDHKFRPEISQAFEGKIGRSMRFSNTVKEDMLYVGLPVIRGDDVTEVLRVSLYIRDIHQLRSDLKSRIWLLVLLITAVSSAGALYLSRSISRPVRELRAASRSVASGDFNTRVFFKNRDEMRDLGRSFNEMTARIKSLFLELSLKKEELSSILFSIKEGLVAIDKNDKIVLSNESLCHLVENDQIDGKFYWEVIRNPGLDNLIKKVKKDQKDCTEELELKDKIFLCSAIFLKPREEIVITLHDLTQIREVENMKKEFILNASHELRTPLAAIKGFVETLEDDIDQKNKNYLEIIKRNTDRLINIVSDLQLLSRLEEKEAQLELGDVHVKKIIDNILKIFEEKLNRKKIEINIQEKNDIPVIQADPYQLEKMFINLVDNAEKYTEKGKISISLEHRDKSLFIEFSDTGIGIAEEHLSRIFERFYVVDKSRSRQLGGTGLGLSIVKHIVLQHGGQATVESKVGQGTKFIIRLPISQVLV